MLLYRIKKTPLSYGVPKFLKPQRLPFFHYNGCTLSPFSRRLYANNFYATFFPLTPPKSINEKRRTNRRTEAEWPSRRTETINKLNRNGRLEE